MRDTDCEEDATERAHGHRLTQLASERPAEDPVPYSSPLEHLRDHIHRIALLSAAHLSRLPARGKRRRARHPLLRRPLDGEPRELEPEELAHVAAVFGDDLVPRDTLSLWEAADQKLVEILWREAATLAVAKSDAPFDALPLCRIADRFGLSELEQDLLLYVAAPKLDPRYAEHWEALDPDFGQPRVQSAIATFARTFEQSVEMRRMFSTQSRLISSSLLIASRVGSSEGDFLDIMLEVPRRVVSELLGESELDEELVAFSRLRTPTVPLDQVVLPAEQKQLVVSLAENHDQYLERRSAWGVDEVISYGKGLVLLFSGPPGTGKTMLAHAVARELEKRLFCIDAGKLSAQGKSVECALDAVFREARLLDAVLFFDECEQIFLSRERGNGVMPMLLTRIEQFDGVAILATNMEHVLDEALARRIIAKIDFRPPSPKAREAIWRNHVPASMPVAADVDFELLAESYELTGGTIKNAVLAAVVQAVGRKGEAVTMADLEHGARLQIRFSDHETMSLLEPEVALADVVLPGAERTRIERFVRSARARATVLTEWGFGKALGRDTGLTALLAGAAGTGKTMTAEAIAKELERPLLRINLASVLSKWVGETAKNLERLFRTAREHRAVLVFDEADALFAKRVTVESANDRFVNAETGALLTGLERHDGVVVLTSNLVEQIDPAFDRRIQLRVDFTLPGPAARTRIWQRHLPGDAPLAADVDPAKLGRMFELSGGLIRNAVMAAALEAAAMPAGERTITQAMLERAAREQAGLPVAMPVINAIGSA
ncbi:MAG: AAA family ATPase [Deltaproteobacteria bacterium]|jgi:SpoVK/Ycf46/Vps4 family AAA+-type ATPase|nr:AAA family ATPase [Deltaproteobacteria bacterium]MBW2534748.1 AAA family ATPase [Deltaproteobacteria bacterium]